MLQQFEEIAAQENLAAAEHQKEDSGRGELIEQIFDLGRGHFTEPEPIAFGEGPPALFDYANDWNPLVDLTQREIDPDRIDMDNRT